VAATTTSGSSVAEQQQYHSVKSVVEASNNEQPLFICRNASVATPSKVAGRCYPDSIIRRQNSRLPEEDLPSS
jgi:hypothetical protein